MSPRAKVDTGEISLPSFRDGISFKVLPLNFGGFKVMGRAEAEGVAPVDVLSIMVMETLKRDLPNVTVAEVDAVEMDDMLRLIDLVTEANKGLKEDFTPPTSTGS